ncbi:helix-turn-helix domain-containing protein, partial [Niastella populi]|uniref:helix-turn-helix domain-containing protein n=1 Tax=Niastella populi TaxID=550983 RepID=UPI0009C1A573
MAKPKRDIANNLKWYRESFGYSLKDVADMLGYTSISSISNWETGTVIPNLFTAFKLSRL